MSVKHTRTERKVDCNVQKTGVDDAGRGHVPDFGGIAFAADTGAKTLRQVYDLGNGVTAVVVVDQIEKTAMPARDGNSMTFSDVASPKKTQHYNFLENYGNFCDLRVWNDATKNEGTQMKVTFKATVNGKTTSFSPVLVDPQWRAYIQLNSNQPDKGINGGVDATMEAVDAPSVPYTFVASQDWM